MRNNRSNTNSKNIKVSKEIPYKPKDEEEGNILDAVEFSVVTIVVIKW